MPSFADEMRAGICARQPRRADATTSVEGVRAVIVDKDNDPQLGPADAGGRSTDEMIDEIFAPLPEREEWTPRFRRPDE